MSRTVKSSNYNFHNNGYIYNSVFSSPRMYELIFVFLYFVLVFCIVRLHGNYI